MCDNEIQAGRVYGTQSMDKPNRERSKCRELERVDAELRLVKRQLEIAREEVLFLKRVKDAFGIKC